MSIEVLISCKWLLAMTSNKFGQHALHLFNEKKKKRKLDKMKLNGTVNEFLVENVFISVIQFYIS